jgi:hypothetical protein
MRITCLCYKRSPWQEWTHYKIIRRPSLSLRTTTGSRSKINPPPSVCSTKRDVCYYWVVYWVDSYLFDFSQYPFFRASFATSWWTVCPGDSRMNF